jgi:nucleoside 2-deoxyribosyltransferase
MEQQNTSDLDKYFYYTSLHPTINSVIIEDRMKLYLAGPMRGYPNWNFAAFEEARTRLRAEDHTVFCPAANALAMGYAPQEGPCDRSTLEHVIQMDIACIYAADAVAILPGWEASVGCTVEVSLAQFLSMPIYDARTMKELTPARKPWHELLI